METLNISDRTPRSENRFKTLLWPTLQNDVDVDTVTRQGFWLCVLVGVASLVVSAIAGELVAGLIESAFFVLAGMGVRRRSFTAAMGALAVYGLATVILLRVGNFSVVRIFMTALLLANVRGIWLTARFRAESQEPPPLPMESTWSERLSDRSPIAVWPWGRWIFYILLPLMLASSVYVLAYPPR